MFSLLLEVPVLDRRLGITSLLIIGKILNGIFLSFLAGKVAWYGIPSVLMLLNQLLVDSELFSRTDLLRLHGLGEGEVCQR